MAEWPQLPVWTDLEDINRGNQYQASDGITFEDLNNIIQNLLYLYKYGGNIATNTLQVEPTADEQRFVPPEKEYYNEVIVKAITKPWMDTSKVTSWANFFSYNDRTNLIDKVDTSGGIMFHDMCTKSISLKVVPPLNVQQGINFNAAFMGCTNLKTVGALNSGNGVKFGSTFRDCTSLETIESIDVSKGEDLSYMFLNCTALKEIRFTGHIISNISFAQCLNLSKESYQSIINALYDYHQFDPDMDWKKTITLPSSVESIDNYYIEIIVPIISKGWNAVY